MSGYVYRCTYCGGELEVNTELSTGVCNYCDSTIIIPKELNKKGNLYNRANFLRQNNEFDKASEVYEEILKEDSFDAEAHWGLVLSEYGIEYVSDPITKERKPTCHRTQKKSILSDVDYLETLKYLDNDAQDIIKKEAHRIHEIQIKIIEISEKEPPYDVFICYKDSDEFENRTEDSVLAQELYYELIKKGYKVFFSRKTLEGKLGIEYEPIIFAALQSAKVMIVLGTKIEHFNAIWVRNEWSRFSKLSKKSNKTIIPAYRGISPYELPIELSVLQSQDMSKIGFMSDLVEGIEKSMGRNLKTNDISKSDNYSGIVSAERLVQKGETYLKLNDLVSAIETYTELTKQYPEDYRGWWGLIVCKTNRFKEVIVEQSELNLWFNYVRQLANESDYSELKQKYVIYTEKNSEVDTLNEVEEVNRRIAKLNKNIQQIKEEINSKNSYIGKKENSLHADIMKDNSKITDCQNEIDKCKVKCTVNNIQIFICFVLVIIGLSMMVSALFPAVIFIGIGLFCCFNVWQNKKFNDPNLAFAEKKLVDAKKEKENNDKLREVSLTEAKASIKRYDEKIIEVQNKIGDCNNYLLLGNEKILAMFHFKRCKAFGVDQKFDIDVMKKHESAFKEWDGENQWDDKKAKENVGDRKLFKFH